MTAQRLSLHIRDMLALEHNHTDTGNFTVSKSHRKLSSSAVDQLNAVIKGEGGVGMTEIPKHIKIGYLRAAVSAYIPNPLRCFNCQKFV